MESSGAAWNNEEVFSCSCFVEDTYFVPFNQSSPQDVVIIPVPFAQWRSHSHIVTAPPRPPRPPDPLLPGAGSTASHPQLTGHHLPFSVGAVPFYRATGPRP